MAELKLVGLSLARVLREAKGKSPAAAKKLLKDWEEANLEAVKKQVLADLKKRKSKK